MKKILSVLLCICMVVSMSSLALATETEPEVPENPEIPVDPFADCTCGKGISIEHAEDCPHYVAFGTVESKTAEEVLEEAVEITADTVWAFEDGVSITFKLDDTAKSAITVKAGVTFALTGNGSIFRAAEDGEFAGTKCPLITVEKGGKLIIIGSEEGEPFTVDGNSVVANSALIKSSGDVELSYTVVQNGKNRSTSQVEVKNENDEVIGTKEVPNGLGGGIYCIGSLTVKNSIITGNTSSKFGGGIYAEGQVWIEDSIISDNVAASAEPEPEEGVEPVNAGRGGGFDLYGSNTVGMLRNVTITENTAMYYGGGGQIRHGAKLTMDGDTVFSDNQALLHGAGAMHVTEGCTFIMNGGAMVDNTAQSVGGAIHSSYSCTLHLNSGIIEGNTANGRGGGIHINTGGAITLGEGIIIRNNTVNNQGTGISSTLNETGDVWGAIKTQAPVDCGYGGGVLIDSGTCTVAGATITGNHAAVGGGGIALTMLNMSGSGLDDVMAVNFTMTGGLISGNTTDGDGAGVYLMYNKAQENFDALYGELKNGSEDEQKEYEKHLATITAKDADIFTRIPTATITGGTICGNIADGNGGGLYLDENTKFIIEDGQTAEGEPTSGTIEGNKAVNGAGVYIAEGTAEIKGGTITGNEASGEGGAVYVHGTEGNETVSMTAGAVEGNTAMENGGAFYVAGGDFNMTSGQIINNEVVKGENENSYDYPQGLKNGGGIYLTDGNVKIGVKDCIGAGTAENPTPYHPVDGKDVPHPVITGNTAPNCGGGIAVMGTGDITLYCGDVTGNDATNKGRGDNVYMTNGDLTRFPAAEVQTVQGIDGDPGLVIIGGNLIDNELDTTEVTNLWYHHCNEPDCTHGDGTSTAIKKATATTNSYINLPDGEYYWTADEGYRFFGWAFYGPNDAEAQKNVRGKYDYKAMGTPIQVTGSTDGNADDTENMYALWAPVKSTISYQAGSVVDGVYTDNAIEASTGEYSLNVDADYVLDLRVPTKSGYNFAGWYMYQNEGQNANWNYEDASGNRVYYEPVYTDGTTSLDFNSPKLQFIPAVGGECKLTVPATTFGDITLIAKFTTKASAVVELKAAKLLDDKAATGNGYSFVLKKGDNVIQTVTNTDGDITFVPLSFDAPGTYVYTVSEVKGTSTRIKYDDTVYTVTIDVTEGNSKYEAAVAVTKADGTPVTQMEFRNETKSTPPTIIPIVPIDPIIPEPEPPVVEPEEPELPKGNQEMEDPTIDLNDSDIPQDNMEIGDPDVPKTSDNSNLMLWLMLAALSAAGMAGIALTEKKEQ